MWQEFKAFLVKNNIIALAVAFVVGAATNELVQAFVADFIMPIIGRVTPGGTWREWGPTVGGVQFLVGHFLGALLSFVIVALVAWQIARALIKPPPADAKPATRPCPYCKQSIDALATRCSYCTSQLAAV
jgi:large conductance mechanosensitive channel